MNLRVFKQLPPIDTGERMPTPSYGSWHKPNLREVGVVETWEQAKELTAAPIVEQIQKR